jgi:hypothetical protein
MGKYYPACRLRGTTHLNARFITSTVIISSCGNHAAGGSACLGPTATKPTFPPAAPLGNGR